MECFLILAAAAFLFLGVFVGRSILTSRAREAAPVIPRQRFIKIGDASVAQCALVENADAFSNRPSALFGAPLVTGPRRRRSDNINSAPHGPLWRALRCNLSSEVLHTTRFASFAPLRRAAVDAVLTDLRRSASHGEVVMVVRSCLYTAVFSMVARLCFGDDAVNEAQVRSMQRDMQAFVLAVGASSKKPAAPPTKLHKLVQWRRWWRRRDHIAFRRRQAEVFLPLIEARRKSSSSSQFCNGKDFRSYVDSLLDLRVPNVDNDLDDDKGIRRALTDDEMVSLVSEFLGAGTETVVACVEWTLAHLVTQPEIQKKLRREIIANCSVEGDNGCLSEEGEVHTLHRSVTPYLHAVVLESLRMHPTVPFAMRDVRAEGAVVGQTAMPEGGLRVHFALGDMGRDPKTWTDPEMFQPERFLAGGEGEAVGPLPGPKEIRMMPFGAGRRYCPGMGLAMLNIKCFLAALVRDFEWTEECSVDLTELNGFFKVMKNPLRAGVTPRSLACST